MKMAFLSRASTGALGGDCAGRGFSVLGEEHLQ